MSKEFYSHSYKDIGEPKFEQVSFKLRNTL